MKYQGFRNSVNGREIGRVGRQWIHFCIVWEGGADSLKFSRGWRFSQRMSQCCFIKAQIDINGNFGSFQYLDVFHKSLLGRAFYFEAERGVDHFLREGSFIFSWEKISWGNLLWWRRVSKNIYRVGFTSKIIILVKRYTNDS